MAIPVMDQPIPVSFVQETEDVIHVLRKKKEELISEIESGSCNSLSRFETYRTMFGRIDAEIESLESELNQTQV